MRNLAAGLVAVAFFILGHTALALAFHPYAREHMTDGGHVVGDVVWTLALESALAVAGIVMALVPLRRGERWALWTLLAVWAILLATRLASDPRCLVVLDMHRHGCHIFMLATVLAFVGLALAGFSRSPARR